MGVFATRSPFRPNPLAISSVKLLGIEHDFKLGDMLRVCGSDLMDNTPIYDIKPYIPYCDSHPDAIGGFADSKMDYHLKVDFPDRLLAQIPENKREALKEVLSQDPRPSYQSDETRIYGMPFSGFDIRFKVSDGILSVTEVKIL